MYYDALGTNKISCYFDQVEEHIIFGMFVLCHSCSVAPTKTYRALVFS